MKVRNDISTNSNNISEQKQEKEKTRAKSITNEGLFGL